MRSPQASPDGVYFAYPVSNWQRTSNENTNWRTDLSVRGPEIIKALEDRLNIHPHKTFN